MLAGTKWLPPPLTSPQFPHEAHAAFPPVRCYLACCQVCAHAFSIWAFRKVNSSMRGAWWGPNGVCLCAIWWWTQIHEAKTLASSATLSPSCPSSAASGDFPGFLWNRASERVQIKELGGDLSLPGFSAQSQSWAWDFIGKGFKRSCAFSLSR